MSDAPPDTGDVSTALDADRLLASARRPLVLGIGGGGDGALATAEACRRLRRRAGDCGGVPATAEACRRLRARAGAEAHSRSSAA